MSKRQSELTEFIDGLSTEERELIERFLKYRSDYLDAERGLPPWPWEINNNH